MRKIILCIICLLLVLMVGISSCTTHNTVEPTPMPTPQPCYVLEYTKGVTILREVR